MGESSARAGRGSRLKLLCDASATDSTLKPNNRQRCVSLYLDQLGSTGLQVLFSDKEGRDVGRAVLVGDFRLLAPLHLRGQQFVLNLCQSATARRQRRPRPADFFNR